MPRRAALDQSDLFPALPDAPDGFAYATDLMSEAEEAGLITRFADLPFRPFDFHGYEGNRRVVSYGWKYDHAGRALRASEPLPAFLLPLREKAAAFADLEPVALAQALVTEYAPGAGIGWHRDKAVFDQVLAISLGAPCRLRLRRRLDGGWERRAVIVAPRSIYRLRGPVRTEWEHSIPPQDRLRYSVTFRSLTG